MATKTKPKEEVAQVTDKERPKLANVHEAILYVMERCPYVHKTGKMAAAAGGYSYPKEADVINAVHDLMVEARLTLAPVSIEDSFQEQYPSQQGKIQHRTTFRVTYEMTHAPSGTKTLVAVRVCGVDPADKAEPKAMTMARKHALLQVFLLETGDDPDRVASSSMAREEVADPPPEQYTPPATQNATRQDPPKADKEAFDKAMAAIPRASNVETLDKYRQTYTKRGFSAKNLATLDAAYADRYAQLTAKVATTNGAAGPDL